MKKIKSLIVLTLISISCFSQEFMGIKVEGSKETVIPKFKYKGFKVVKNEGSWVQMSGQMNGVEIELHILFTPISGRCWKFSVFLPEKTSWESIKLEYLTYRSILVEKYGTPTGEVSLFKDPYFEGDGYEMSAIILDKCAYVAIWLDKGIEIDISKYRQVRISYENGINSEIDTKENNDLKKVNL